MKTIFEVVPVFEVSIEELQGRIGQDGEMIPWEYDLGLYYEIDSEVAGEIANIKRIIENGLLPKKQSEAILKKLNDADLDVPGRKNFERGIKKLKILLHTNLA